MSSPEAIDLAQRHWNETPLYLSAEERYGAYPWLPEAAEFSRHRSERVLELGCGTGCDLLQFALHGAIATGVDMTEAHVHLARERIARATIPAPGSATVIRGDIRRLGFEEASFDYVYSHGVIHHSDEPRKIVEQMFRVLRPGGRFNIHLYSLYSLATLMYMLRYRGNWKNKIENSETPVHIDLYTARSLRKLLSPAKVTIRKYEIPHLKSLEFVAPALGWYITATGIRPERW